MFRAADKDLARLRRAAVELLAHGMPAGELAALRERFELPGPPADESPARAEPGHAAASLRAALTAGSATGLTRLVDDVRAAGEWDDRLEGELVRRVRPARTLAGHLSGTLPQGGAAAASLAELARRHLGDAPERWRGLHDALATSRETLPELLAARPAPVRGGTPLPPKSVCDTLALLLEHAPREHAAAALTQLPDRPCPPQSHGTAIAGRAPPSPATRGSTHASSRSSWPRTTRR
jgi:hypothetical protein